MCREFLFRCIPTTKAERVQSSSLTSLGDHLALTMGSLISRVPKVSWRAEFLETGLMRISVERQALDAELVQLRVKREKEKTELSSLRSQNADLRTNRNSVMKPKDFLDEKEANGMKNGFQMAQAGQSLEGHHVFCIPSYYFLGAAYESLSDTEPPIIGDITKTASEEDLANLQALL
ncbi:hypothetical protein E3N88_09898 [Mikania micrantha]|uniref:Uncharacterized protein n=1 Tax=Mikania micrantha TaxID=192012 RepID=A0A5N6PBF7_9ASTR|nr:hypothetical protein E3N88_09898 [Mikania micrantha]